MATPRQSYQQRLFSDEELPLQSHDRIVRWMDLALRGSTHIILDALGIPYKLSEDGCVGWSTGHVYDDLPDHQKFLKEAVKLIARKVRPKHNYPPLIKVDEIKWEPIIKDNRGVVVGAVDLSAKLRVPKPALKVSCGQMRCDLLHKIDSIDDTILGPRDVFWFDGKISSVFGVKANFELDVPPLLEGEIGYIVTRHGSAVIHSMDWDKWDDYYDDISLMIEAKTKLKSVGELIRQLNLYKSFVSNHKFVLVAPADQLEPDARKILQEQDILIVNYLAN